MRQKSEKRRVCRHCGGALIDKVEETSCIMCGRLASHVCERCQFVEERAAKTRKSKGARAA